MKAVLFYKGKTWSPSSVLFNMNKSSFKAFSVNFLA